jgi:molybdate transport system ATP-binding protein
MLEIDIQLRRESFELNVACALGCQATGVFGRSGAGKTTLLHCLAGLLKPTAGRIVLDGETLFDSARGIHVPPHRRRIAMVFQDGRLFPHYSVRGNLQYGLSLLPRCRRRFTLPQVAELLELTPLLDEPPNRLSGGQRQRVALGRALLSSPGLLLLDEPLSGLDATLKREILPFLCRVQREANIPILMVSHSLGEILCLTDRLLLMEGGTAAAHGHYAQLLRNEASRRLLRAGDLANVLRCVVSRPEAGGITTLTPLDENGSAATRDEREVFIKASACPEAGVGSEAWVVLRPEDIALARGPVEHLSMQNQLPGRLVRVLEPSRRALCVVDVGVELLVEVTPQAVADMQLAPGQRVWAAGPSVPDATPPRRQTSPVASAPPAQAKRPIREDAWIQS